VIRKIKEIIRLWRSKCPFIRIIEEWRMKKKTKEFKLS